jgi:hypothetical protein
MMPELSWLSPVYHPNISASGVVCLGGYGTHWVPSLSLDELCEMLWDMIRYRNYDVESPYNREAALWAKAQSAFRLPVDERPIRDRVAGGDVPATLRPALNDATVPPADAGSTFQPEVVIIEDDGEGEVILTAELLDAEDVNEDIVFLD